MHAVIFADKFVDFLPLQQMPEVLLPYCNIPLLSHILRFLEQHAVAQITLVGADPAVRQFAESLPQDVQLQFCEAGTILRTAAPTLVLFRPCLPHWDMGELRALCGDVPVQLCRRDGSSCDAALYPMAAPLLPPKNTVTAVLSEFRVPHSQEEYRRMQQVLLRDARMQSFRLGQGVHIGKHAEISASTIIGNDCVIGERAVLEDCVLGDGVQVGAEAVLRRCVICRHALIDRNVQMKDAALGQGEIAAAHHSAPQKRLLQVDGHDGIHEGLPRWNTAVTALQAGAAMTALGKRIGVGFDCPQAEGFALAAAAGAVSQGAQVWNAGICALSQLIYMGRAVHCDALLWAEGESVQLLRPYSGDGFPLNSTQIRRVRQAYDAQVSTRILPCGKLLDALPFTELWKNECRRILPEHDFRIEVCCGNSALRQTAQELFRSGNGGRIVLNLSDDGMQASAFSAESGMVHHDQLLLLSLLSMRENGEALALPAQFHPAAEQFAARYGGRILRLFTPKVSPTAAALYAKQGVCTDGILLFAHILRVLQSRRISLKAAASLLPPMYTARSEISTTLSPWAVEKLRRSNPDSAVRIALPSYSGMLRVMVHAESMEAAAELCGFWEKRIRAAEQEMQPPKHLP